MFNFALASFCFKAFASDLSFNSATFFEEPSSFFELRIDVKHTFLARISFLLTLQKVYTQTEFYKHFISIFYLNARRNNILVFCMRVAINNDANAN